MELGHKNLPKSWKWVKLEEILTDKPCNGLYKSGSFIGKGILFLDIGGLYKGLTADFSEVRRVEVTEGEYNKYNLQKGDILINRVSKKAEGVGKAVVVDEIKEPAVYESNMIRVRLNQKKIDSLFLIYYLSSNRSRQELLSKANISNQASINQQAIKSLKIPLPPLEEQRRIAAILDKADGVRRKRQEAIQLTEELLRSQFLEMFGDPGKNPKGWEVNTLGKVLIDIESGWSPKCDSREAEAEEWGVLKLGAVTYGYFNPSENKAMLPVDSPRSELEVKPGDLLFARKNTYELVGASAFVHTTRPKLMLPDLIFRLCLSNAVDPVYLWQVLSQKTMRYELSRLAGGTAGSMPNISKTRLRTLSLPVPPLDLQLKYRDFVNRFWDKQKHQNEFSKVSDNLFNSLLQRAFRGEL